MNVEALMEEMAAAGVTVLLKADAERFAEARAAWTFVATGDVLGPGGSVRTDARTMRQCVEAGLAKLRELGFTYELPPEA